MIGAGDIEHHRAANTVFLRDADRGFHIRQLAGNNDLIGRIDVGDINIFIRGEPAHVVFQPANHSGHPALRACTSLRPVAKSNVPAAAWAVSSPNDRPAAPPMSNSPDTSRNAANAASP